MKIASVICQVLSTARLDGAERYEDTAGLTFPQAVPEGGATFEQGVGSEH